MMNNQPAITLEQARTFAKQIHAPFRQNHITIHANGRIFIKRYGALRLHLTPQHRALIYHDARQVMLYIGYSRSYWPITRVTKNTLYFYSRPTYHYYAQLFQVPHKAPIRLRFIGKPINLITGIAWQLDTRPTTDIYSIAQNMQHQQKADATFTP